MDLLDNGKDNEPRFWFVFIGTNNRYGVALPLNSKNAEDVRDALNEFINEYKPAKLTSDQEKAFMEHIPDLTVGEAAAVNLPLVDVHLKLVALLTAHARKSTLGVAYNVTAGKSAQGSVGGINQLYGLELLCITAVGGEGGDFRTRKCGVKNTEIALGTAAHDGKVGIGRAESDSALNILAHKRALVVGRFCLENAQNIVIL